MSQIFGDENHSCKIDFSAALAARLPFALQKQANMPETMIDSVEVLSIDEWNERYGLFPLHRVAGNVT